MRLSNDRLRAGVWGLVAQGAIAVSLGCGYPVVERVDLTEARAEGRLNGLDPERVLASSTCSKPSPGRAPLWRLSNAEYENTLTDLLGDRELVSEATRDFPSEPESLGFRNAADTLTVNPLMAGRYQSAAERIAGGLSVPCATETEEECAESFLRTFGMRVYRRPLSDGEIERYLDLFRQARERDGMQASLRWLAAALLQSPHFLYRVTVPGSRGTERVSDFEMAQRLSYLLWQSTPDDALLDAAARGELRLGEQVRGQVARMLGDPKAARVYEFFAEWLGLDDLSEVRRDPELYPDLSPRLAELLRAESRAFVQDLLTRPQSNVTDLLTREETFANRELTEHYGLSPVSGDLLLPVAAPGRFGILTQGMLAVRDHPTRTSIVRRGLAIRTNFLCDTVPAPPANVDLTLAGIGADLTQKQRLEQHREAPACNGCHEMMDPLGVLFEGFDAAGRARDQDEYGSEVETESFISGTRDLDGAYRGLDEFAPRLALSPQFRECYMLQHFRFFYGRDATGADLCSEAELMKRFEDQGGSLVALLIGLTETDAFVYKPGLSTSEEEP